MEKYHHLGIVVADIDRAIKSYIQIYPSYKMIAREAVKSEMVEIALVSDGYFTVEFVCPLNEKSPVSAFLKKGGGIHHVCFVTNSIDEYFEKNKEDIKIIKGKHIGFFDSTTAFFVQRNFDSGMLLYELVEQNCKEFG